MNVMKTNYLQTMELINEFYVFCFTRTKGFNEGN